MRYAVFQFALPVILGCATFTGIRAAEPYVDFLRGLQKRGYGEAALAYLDQITESPNLPAELRTTLDLERSTSLRIAADEASTPEDRKTRLDDAHHALDEFRSRHSAHPALGETLNQWADALLQKAEQAIGSAKMARKDEATKARLCADANTWLAEARTLLLQSSEQTKRLFEVKKHAAVAEAILLEAQFKTAYTDYLLAQTITGGADQRKKALQQSGREFDEIFQTYRTKRAGILAHLWHGKTVEESGEPEAAIDFYDEVLVTAPEADAPLEDAAIYGQAELFRLRLLATTRSAKEVADEGNEWLKQHRRWSAAPAFQGVALEVAKASLTLLGKTSGAESARLKQQTLALLANVAKGESDYKQEALLLRKELLVKTGGASGSLSFDEALATGDAAASGQDWQSASEQYRKALEIAQGMKPPAAHLELAQRRLNQSRYQLALDAYHAHKYDESITLAGDLVKAHPNDPVAETAMTLAINAAMEGYTSARADQRQPAAERVERLARFAIKTWPAAPPGDEGRVALLRLQMQTGDREAALQLIDEVPVQSKRYAAAQQLAGQIHWERYVQARKSSDPAAAEPPPAESLQAACEHLRLSVERQHRDNVLSEKKLPKALVETQLLLVNALLEGKSYAEAAPLANQLLEDLRDGKPASITATVQQTCIAAVKANLG